MYLLEHSNLFYWYSPITLQLGDDNNDNDDNGNCTTGDDKDDNEDDGAMRDNDNVDNDDGNGLTGNNGNNNNGDGVMNDDVDDYLVASHQFDMSHPYCY